MFFGVLILPSILYGGFPIIKSKYGNEYLFNQVKDAYDILMGNKTQEIVPVQRNVFDPFSMLQGPSHGLFSSMNQLFDTSLETDNHLFSNKLVK